MLTLVIVSFFSDSRIHRCDKTSQCGLTGDGQYFSRYLLIICITFQRNVCRSSLRNLTEEMEVSMSGGGGVPFRAQTLKQQQQQKQQGKHALKGRRRGVGLEKGSMGKTLQVT